MNKNKKSRENDSFYYYWVAKVKHSSDAYVFDGWHYGNTKVKDGDALAVFENHTLTAHWRKKHRGRFSVLVKINRKAAELWLNVKAPSLLYIG